MNTGQQTRRLVSRAGHSICRSCNDTITRAYASAAAAAVQTEDQVAQHIPPVAQVSPSSAYSVNAGVVLSRPPQITRDLHPFEAAFFLYQRRLNERLALPFTRYFYVKTRTPANLEWKRKMRQRLTPARDIGRYNAYGDEAWNDELLVGAQESNFAHQVEKLLEDAEHSGLEDAQDTTGGKSLEREPVEKPMPRVTEADQKNDTKSLNRALQRTLYLLVKNKEGQWQFPQDRLNDEHLHGAANRIITHAGGVNMNTWLVGHVPIGHYQLDYRKPRPSGALQEYGAKTFFMKARIMAGQVDLKENKLGLQDFKWLAKEELKSEVDGSYWRAVKNMLVER